MTRTLIRYAGWEPPRISFHRKIPVERALELRSEGMTWATVANQLSEEYTMRKMPFTADGVQSACNRAAKKRETTNA